MRLLPWLVVAHASVAAADGVFDANPLAGSTLCHDDPMLCLAFGARLRGVVTDTATHDVAIGATVVAVGPAMRGEQVTITDEHGVFGLDVPDGVYTLTVYYLDATVTRGDVVVSGRTDVPLSVDGTAGPVYHHGFSFGGPVQTEPEISSSPRFGVRVGRERWLVARDRTHRAWVAPAAAADPRVAMTTLDGGARLAGAPGIPLAFLDEAETSTIRSPLAAPAGAGGTTELGLRYGTNQPRVEVRLLGERADTAATGVELFGGAPVSKDRAWLALGFVGTRDASSEGQVLGQLQWAASPDHLLSVAALHQALTDVRDTWAQLRSRSRFDDGKLEVSARATVESLTRSITSERVGAELVAQQRARFEGHHAIVALAGGGGGMHGDTTHADYHAGLGDVWSARPELEIGANLRVDARRFGETTTELASTRLWIAHDHTKEGRADTFLAYQRVPHLDDGLPGAWLGHARYHDELVAGASFLPFDDTPLMIGVAGRTRFEPEWDAPRMGIDAWLRYQTERTLVGAAATTFDDVATLFVERSITRRRRHALDGAVSVRTSARPALDQRAADPHETLAAGLRYRYHPARDLVLDLTLELFGGSEGDTGRVVVGAAF